MKENLVLANYKVESEAYQALSELKRETTNANYTISQAVIVKKDNGKLSVMDGFVNGATTGDDTMTGGLIGSLVGILGGPLGILLGPDRQLGWCARRAAWGVAWRKHGHADRWCGRCRRHGR